MYFNSLDFAVFLPLVFILYWSLYKNLKAQNVLILITSYIFYGWWDWRFLFLIILSTLVDFVIGFKLQNQDNKNKRKILLGISLIINIGILGIFKYYNFFIDSFIDLNPGLAYVFGKYSLNILLPVGISFYTFQTLSYTIDVYRRKIDSSKDIISFAAFISFFPQLVAGPIERASNLLPQFRNKRLFNFEFAFDGIRQIIWGFFMKIVIADNCAIYANEIFGNHDQYNSSTLLLGALMFTFQIYGDFAGYSNIAIGTAKLFGIKLMNNFSFPYFSRDIAEFWRRWHISLSTWFRDYLYIPLGGSNGSIIVKIRNTVIVFVISGFWHGANWTFVIWGCLNALLFIPLLILNKNRKHLDIVGKNELVKLKDIFNIIITFSLTVLVWIFFRAENITHAFSYIRRLFSNDIFSPLQIYPIGTFILIFSFLIIEWFGRKDDYALQKILHPKNNFINLFILYLVVISIYIFGSFSSNYEFIYFQF